MFVLLISDVSSNFCNYISGSFYCLYRSKNLLKLNKYAKGHSVPITSWLAVDRHGGNFNAFYFIRNGTLFLTKLGMSWSEIFPFEKLFAIWIGCICHSIKLGDVLSFGYKEFSFLILWIITFLLTAFSVMDFNSCLKSDNKLGVAAHVYETYTGVLFLQHSCLRWCACLSETRRCQATMLQSLRPFVLFRPKCFQQRTWLLSAHLMRHLILWK